MGCRIVTHVHRIELSESKMSQVTSQENGHVSHVTVLGNDLARLLALQFLLLSSGDWFCRGYKR